MVVVDKETCIGCGTCPNVCEKVFEMKEDKAYVKEGEENSTDPDVKEAIEACPVDAISD